MDDPMQTSGASRCSPLSLHPIRTVDLLSMFSFNEMGQVDGMVDADRASNFLAVYPISV